MDVFKESDYRVALRKRIKELAQFKKSFTLKKLAAQIPVQYTYLSRVLGDSKSHLNDDHFFIVCRRLELLPEEIEYLTLLRSLAMSEDPDRKTYLKDRISRFQQAHQVAATVQDFDSRRVLEELAYLADPISVIAYVTLHVPEFAENPRLLCQPLGIDARRLRQILKKLESLSLVELNESRTRVTRIKQGQIHYGTDHPLMRTHQHLLRNICVAQVLRSPEDIKKSFMVTFTAEKWVLKQISERFEGFLREVESLVRGSKPKNCYQMNFDLFQWMGLED